MGMYTKLKGWALLNDGDISKAIVEYYNEGHYDIEGDLHQHLWEYVFNRTGSSVIFDFMKNERWGWLPTNPGCVEKGFEFNVQNGIWQFGTEMKAYCNSMSDFMDIIIPMVSDNYYVEQLYEENCLPLVYIKKLNEELYLIDSLYQDWDITPSCFGFKDEPGPLYKLHDEKINHLFENYNLLHDKISQDHLNHIKRVCNIERDVSTIKISTELLRELGIITYYICGINELNLTTGKIRGIAYHGI